MSSAAHRSWRLLIALVLLIAVVPAIPSSAQEAVPNVLVFSGTYGFRHDSIQKGNDVLQQLADETGAFTVDFTELPTDLSGDNVRTYDMVLFNSSTGRFPLSAEQRADLVRYWGCGGGTIAVHAAADANYGWAEWAELIGAQFDGHPHGAGAGDVTVDVENAEHPVNGAYAEMTEWVHADELYKWKREIRGTQDVLPLLSLDTSTVDPSIQEGDSAYLDGQPLSYVKTFRGQGRVLNNNFGHNQATWDHPEFQQSLVDGITWVGEVQLDEACFDGDAPLPPPPAAPDQAPLDPDNPREGCVVEEGQQRLTLDGLTYDGQHAAVPAYFSKSTAELVLDLSSSTALYADVQVTHEWPNPVDDYDLSITTPWGFAGSDQMQPVAPATEQAVVTDAVHCAVIRVDLYNHVALTQDAGTVTVTVNPTHEPPAGSAPVAPLPGQVITGPGATSTGYIPPNLVLTQGSSLTLTNADTVGHTVFCADVDENRLPICRSQVATTGGQAQVNGVEDLPPGEYGFYCSLHPGMTGVMTIV